jgi:hypothetical protein
MPTSPLWFEFVETKAFTKRLVDFGSHEVLLAIQADLIENPIRWPAIRVARGARKGRVSGPGEPRGKSGSYRYLYLFLPHVQRIYLLFIFGKKEQDNLSPEQVKRIAQWCDQIREELS